MTIWLDNHLSPKLAGLGPPPAIILLSCGNTSTAYVQAMLRDQLAAALTLVRNGEALVEIGA